MLRIGIIGSDNSHALAFSKLANIDRVLGDRCRVVGIWGADLGEAQQVAAESEIASVFPLPEAMVDAIDLAIVVDRDGALHAEHALPYIERGLPVFVDKPFATNLDDCHRMLNAAQISGSPITSFSALRFAPQIEALTKDLPELGIIKAAHFAGPCDFESPYSGPFFYATHVAEMALALIGSDISTIRAKRSGASVVALVTWEDGALGSFSLLGDAAYHFHVTLFGSEGMTSREVLGGSPCYRNALDQIVRMAETGTQPFAASELIAPIEIVSAIVSSLDASGKEIGLS